jgi:hypothetical protein
MIFVFDNSSLSELKTLYPDIFGSFWASLARLARDGTLLSTREVANEMERGDPREWLNTWLKGKQVFTTPGASELEFVATIFKVPHFQALIGEQQRLKGTPVADPFIIACAKINAGTVVTEEKLKPNAAKIPNVCEYFSIPCINLEEFMKQQRWHF